MEEHTNTKPKVNNAKVNIGLAVIFTFLIASALGFYGGRWYERYSFKDGKIGSRNFKNFDRENNNKWLKNRDEIKPSPVWQEQQTSPNPTTQAVPQGQ